MTACRLHVFPPEDDDTDRFERLQTAFDQSFTSTEATVQSNADEWASEAFEETQMNMERIDEFQAVCEDIYPDADVLRTRQKRAAMDGQGGDEEAIMLNITDAIL